MEKRLLVIGLFLFFYGLTYKYYMINCIYSLKLIESIQLLMSNEAFSSTFVVNSLHVSLKSSICMNYSSV
jgi:uncharacterized membrane protein